MLGSYSMVGNVATYQQATWFEAWAEYNGAYVADLTTGEKVPSQSTLATPSQWVPDPMIYPLVNVTFYLDPAEAGFRYTLHWRVGQQPEMTQSIIPSQITAGFSQTLADGSAAQIPPSAAKITGAVAQSSTFWLTRDYDGASTPGKLMPYGQPTSTSPKVWYFKSGVIPRVDKSGWQDVVFGVAASLGTDLRVATSAVVQPTRIAEAGLWIQDFTWNGAPHNFTYNTVVGKVPPVNIGNAASGTGDTYWLMREGQPYSQGQRWV